MPYRNIPKENPTYANSLSSFMVVFYEKTGFSLQHVTYDILNMCHFVRVLFQQVNLLIWTRRFFRTQKGFIFNRTIKLA